MSERKNPAPAAHDRGGWSTEEPIDPGEHQWGDWERRTQALARVLGSKGIVVTDEMRRGIESIPGPEYEALSYFERWSASLETLLVEKSALTTAEIDEKMKEVEVRWG